MSGKPVVPRRQAKRDIDDALAYYLAEGSPQAALAFIDALERAYIHIANYPASGSIHYAHELNLPGLRCWPLTDFPYLIFYVEQAGHLDIWRVLHGKRDIPAGLQAEHTP